MKSRIGSYTLLLLLAAGLASATNLDTCLQELNTLYQGKCSSDYAVVASAALELKWCIKDPTKYKGLKLSAQDIVCNCEACHNIKNNGCWGGSVKEALEYIKLGKVSGGTYPNVSFTQPTFADTITNYKLCLPYFDAICDPDTETSCQQKTFSTATHCPEKCSDPNQTLDVKTTGTSGILHSYSEKVGFSNIKNAVANGPVIGYMEIFEDMDYYFNKSSEIYVHANGQSLGVVAVIILDYKTGFKDGLDAWRVVVPWDKPLADKAQKQVLNVIAGINHCNLEHTAYELTLTSA